MSKLHPVEGDVKNKVKAILAKRGWWFFMPPANTYGAGGISDILALRAGRFLAIETKLKKATASAHQEVFQLRVAENGGHACVVNMAMVQDGSFDKILDEVEGA